MRHREQGGREWVFLAGLPTCHPHISWLTHVEMSAAHHPGTRGEHRASFLIIPHVDRSQDSKKMGAGRSLHQRTKRAWVCFSAAIKGRKLNKCLHRRQRSPQGGRQQAPHSAAPRQATPVPCQHHGASSPQGTCPWGNLPRETEKCPLALPISSDGATDGAQGNCLPSACPSPPDGSQGRRKTTDASRQFTRRKSITSIKKWIQFPLEQTAQGSAIILQNSQYLL